MSFIKHQMTSTEMKESFWLIIARIQGINDKDEQETRINVEMSYTSMIKKSGDGGDWNIWKNKNEV